MSNRKSTAGTPNRTEFQSQASFVLEKCKQCPVECTRKDAKRHEEDCQWIRESLSKLINDKNAEIKETVVPFLVDAQLLVAPYTMSITKDKVAKNVNSPLPHDNVILLSPELMTHCNISSGRHISISYLDPSTNTHQQHYLVTHSYDGLKSILGTAFVKESVFSQALFSNKEGNACAKVRIDFNVSTMPLKSLSIRVEHELILKDPLYYLKMCVAMKKKLDGNVIHSKGDKLTLEIAETEYDLQVLDFEPDVEQIDLSGLSISNSTAKSSSSVYIVNEQTKIIFSSLNSTTTCDRPFVGYATQMKLLERLIIEKSDLPVPRTILLTGPSGVGKSHAIKCLFDRVCHRMNVVKFDCSLFLSKTFEYERLRTAFRHLVTLRPSIVFMDNLEDVTAGEKLANDKKFAGWLKTILDELQENSTKEPVIVIGATSRPELLDVSLRRPDRFDVEVELPVPSPADRSLILAQVIKAVDPNATLEAGQIEQLGETAHGFTGADLKHLCKMALLPDDEERSRLTFARLSTALRRAKPSIMREITLEKPNVHWTDIGGMHSLRHLLQETVVWPVKHPEAFTRLGIEPPRGILMYGPPGCCKTMIGKALATESGLNFFSIKGPELFSKWVGESERAIREMFRKARAASPSILFFDEIDALAAERGQNQSAVGDRVLAQLLTEIDGVEKLGRVAIIAATNRPDIVDKALMRPGRLDSMVYVPLPDLATRKEIFAIHTRKMRLPVATEEERNQLLDELATKSEGYTGAEVAAICQRAGLIALGESLQTDSVTKEHFSRAFERLKPRIGKEMIAFYDEFASRCEEVKK